MSALCCYSAELDGIDYFRRIDVVCFMAFRGEDGRDGLEGRGLIELQKLLHTHRNVWPIVYSGLLSIRLLWLLMLMSFRNSGLN